MVTKSSLFTRIALCLVALTSSVSMLGMGSGYYSPGYNYSGFYNPNQKIPVTTEEKINDYLNYLAIHGMNAIMQQGIEKAVPGLVERALVDGARILIPDLLGSQSPNQKRLINLGVEGARQAVQFSAKVKELAQRQNQKIKRSEAIKIFMTKKFIPTVAKTLVVDLMYYGVGNYANSLLERFGLNAETLAASPFTFQGMLYQEARVSGRNICSLIFDLAFGKQISQ